MGRSNLQGTPWHYDYLSPNPRKDRTPSHCRFLSIYHICQNKRSLLYGDKCTSYMKNHCKYRYIKAQKTNDNVKKSKQPKQTDRDSKNDVKKSSVAPTISLRNIKYVRKWHSNYFKSKIKPNIKCPKCKSISIHRTQMIYCHGYAKHILFCDNCKHEWEHIVDDSLVIIK